MKTFNEYSVPELIRLITKLHTQDKVSLRAIAKMLGTYPVKIQRFCSKHNIPTLSPGESLKEGYKSKRLSSNRKGVQLSEEEKIAISEKQHQYWNSLSKQDREIRRRKQQEVYQKRTDKKQFAHKGSQAIRRAADEGSKLEKALIEFFTKENIEYYHHYTDLFGGTKLEADFFLPELNVVIEVDGPSHFTANFGEDNYAAQIRADEKKNGLVLSMGASIIRIRHARQLYKRDYRLVFAALLSILPELDNEWRVIDVEKL